MKKENGTNEADNLISAIENLSRINTESARQKKAEFEAKLSLPDFPEEYTFAWQSFFDLNSCRSSNGFGANAISYSEIDAYARLTGKVLLPYEISGIVTIDNCFLKAQNDLHKSAQKAKDVSTAGSKAPTQKRR